MKKRIQNKILKHLFHPKRRAARRNWQSSFNGCLNLAHQFDQGIFNYVAWERLATQIKAEWNVIPRDESDLEGWNELEDSVNRQDDLHKMAGDLEYYSDRWSPGRFYKMGLLMDRFRSTYES